MSKGSGCDRRQFLKTGAGLAALGGLSFVAPPEREEGAEARPLSSSPPENPRGWWPQPYSIHRDEAARKLVLQTRYYTIEHDLKRGGAISRISYSHGVVANLLLQPLGAWVRLKEEVPASHMTRRGRRQETFSDLNDSSPTVSAAKSNRAEVVTVEASLLDRKGRDLGVRTKTTYSYRWGYIKIRKEFTFPDGSLKVRGLSILSAEFDPSLTHYSYKPNIFEDFSPMVHTWEENGWGKMRAGSHFDVPYQTRYVPRYLALVNPGIEGIEWFVSDDLAQWDYQMAGQPGTGNTEIGSRTKPLAVELSIDPLDLAPEYILPRGGYVSASGNYSFDYYLGMPILEGHAHKPWFERSYTPNRGKWVSEEEIRHNAALGVETMTLHNDGDQYGDGLYWRDGSWPPYPPDQMKKMAGVIQNCHKYGIKTVPYFSCHELNQSTPEFKEHGEEWGRKADDQGNLRPNHYYGALMCLKSGWLDYLEHCVDRVLKHYPFDGVYYDWNLALYCDNPLHVGRQSNGVSGTKGLGTYALSPTGHWDVDELLEFVEWSRERVGQDGLVLIHNTMAPMFATGNFSNAVCCMEFGYGQVSTSMPKPVELPLEWNFGGARSRAVIEYGTVVRSAPKSLHQVFYLTALITGVATWPASDGALELFKMLKPLGDLEQYQFEDWRNRVVSLDQDDCFSAVYSRPGEAYLVLANLGSQPRQVTCAVNSQALANPMAVLASAALLHSSQPTVLSIDSLTHNRQKLLLPAEGALLLHIK